MPTFQFQLLDPVAIRCSGETGEVIGRAEYAAAEPNYLIRYRAADGCAVEAWWARDALRAATPDELTRTGCSVVGHDLPNTKS